MNILEAVRLKILPFNLVLLCIKCSYVRCSSCRRSYYFFIGYGLFQSELFQSSPFFKFHDLCPKQVRFGTYFHFFYSYGYRSLFQHSSTLLLFIRVANIQSLSINWISFSAYYCIYISFHLQFYFKYFITTCARTVLLHIFRFLFQLICTISIQCYLCSAPFVVIISVLLPFPLSGLLCFPIILLGLKLCFAIPFPYSQPRSIAYVTLLKRLAFLYRCTHPGSHQYPSHHYHSVFYYFRSLQSCAAFPHWNQRDHKYHHGLALTSLLCGLLPIAPLQIYHISNLW